MPSAGTPCHGQPSRRQARRCRLQFLLDESNKFLGPDPCETLISEGKFLNSLWLLAARLVGVEDAQKSAGMKQTAADYLSNTSAMRPQVGSLSA